MCSQKNRFRGLLAQTGMLHRGEAVLNKSSESETSGNEEASPVHPQPCCALCDPSESQPLTLPAFCPCISDGVGDTIPLQLRGSSMCHPVSLWRCYYCYYFITVIVSEEALETVGSTSRRNPHPQPPVTSPTPPSVTTVV